MSDKSKIIWYSVFGILGGFALIGAIYKRKEITETVLNWLEPITGKVTSPFGDRIHPITNEHKFHNGIDISAPNGTPIKAPIDGTVVKMWTDDINGNGLNIQHGDNMISGYAHLSGYNVKNGQKVKRGDVVGYVGSTGRSTGNHLHFVVKIKGSDGVWQHKDPQKYIKLT